MRALGALLLRGEPDRLELAVLEDLNGFAETRRVRKLMLRLGTRV